MASRPGPFGLAAGAASELKAATRTVARNVGTPTKPPPSPRLPSTYSSGGFKAVRAPRTPVLTTQAQNRAYLLKTVAAVHSGEIDEGQAESNLRDAGFPDSHNPYAQTHGNAIVNLGKGVGETAHAIAKPIGLSRSANIRRATAERAAFVKEHGRPPTIDEIRPSAGIVAPGTGLAAQVLGPLAQGAVYGPGGVVSAVLHPGRTAGQVERHLTHPNPADVAFLGYVAGVGGATAVARGAAATRAVRSGEGVRAALTRSGARGGSLLHTPAPKERVVYAPGARPEAVVPTPAEVNAQRQLVAKLAKSAKRKYPSAAAPGVAKKIQAGRALPGERAKLTKLEAAAQIPEGAPAEGPVHAITVPLGQESRNVLVRPVQRVRTARLQKALEREAQTPGSPRTRTGEAIGRTVSARTTVARNLRAERRVEEAVANTTNDALNRSLHGLTRGEHVAVSVAGVEGPEAFVNPGEVIARHVAAHEHFARIGGNVAENRQRVADLKLAQKALETARPRLKRAVQLAKEASNETERRLIDAGHLTPEVAAGRLGNMARIYGHETPPQGSFFFSQSSRYQPPARAAGAFRGASPGPYGMSEPRPGQRVPGLGQRFTGESVAAGRVPVETGAAIANRGRLVNNLLATERQYQDLWKIASPERRSHYDIPIRDTPRIHEDLRGFFRKLADNLHGSPDELAALTQDEVKNLTDLLEVGDYSTRNAGVGSRVEGVRWVDSRYLADLGGSLRGPLEKLADLINNPARVAQLYARPAYILNLAGNLGMNGISEGVRVFPALKLAAQANKRLGERAMRIGDQGMGVSLSRSYSVGTGPLGRASNRLAEAWNAVTDMHSRRGALFSQLDRMGYKTDEAKRAVLLGETAEARRVRTLAFRVANKNIVDYGSLTPLEQNQIRRLIYFYPWVSRGTIWALRALVENPGKAFTLYQLGQVGSENAHRELGKHLPEWADQLGLIPFGSRGDITKVANPSAVWTPTTAVQAGHVLVDTAKAVAGLGHGSGLGDVLTPAATIFTQATQAGTASGTHRPGIPGLLGNLPQVQAFRRAGLVGQPSKTYPETGVGQGFGPLAAGGAYPRGISRGALASQALTQTTGARAKLRVELDQAVEAGLITQTQADRVKAQMPKATAVQLERYRGRLSRALNASSLYGLNNALVEAVKRHLITRAQAKAVKDEAVNASPEQIAAYRKRLTAAMAGG